MSGGDPRQPGGLRAREPPADRVTQTEVAHHPGRRGGEHEDQHKDLGEAPVAAVPTSDVGNATVGLIWQRQQPIPLWQRRTLRYTVGGRFAAAAALGVAFVIGALFMQTPPVDAAGPQAGATPELVQLMLEGARGDLDPLEERVGDTELGYLPDTIDLDYRDLLGELDRVERDM